MTFSEAFPKLSSLLFVSDVTCSVATVGSPGDPRVRHGLSHLPGRSAYSHGATDSVPVGHPRHARRPHLLRTIRALQARHSRHA